MPLTFIQLLCVSASLYYPARNRWRYVQGGWEADETVEAAAARETVEEAGVRGALEVHSAAVHAAAIVLELCNRLCNELFWIVSKPSDVHGS